MVIFLSFLILKSKSFLADQNKWQIVLKKNQDLQMQDQLMQDQLFDLMNKLHTSYSDLVSIIYSEYQINIPRTSDYRWTEQKRNDFFQNIISKDDLAFQGIELTKTLLFILKVLWFSNNLMQKMTSLTHSIYYIIHLEVFFKLFNRNFDHYEQFRQSLLMIGPYTAIPSIFNQKSLDRDFYAYFISFY